MSPAPRKDRRQGRLLSPAGWLLLALGAALIGMLALPSHDVPVAAAPVGAAPMSAEEEQDALEEAKVFEIVDEPVDGGHRYLVRNLLAGPIEIDAKFESHDNMVADPQLPLRMVVPGTRTTPVLLVTQADATRAASFRLAWQARPGSPRARHSASARYRVPFDDDHRWSLGQGFNGRFSHQLAVSRYALDFEVPVGTPVLAAREGIVMQVQDDYRGSGRQLERDATRANFVRILHDDGTMGMYAHLQQYGVVVKPGQKVFAGEALGLSGDTGYSSGPHLHFAVLANDGSEEISLPFDMDDVDEDLPDD
jgi:murein DD-endopeptidase MepM/ murein hydrolase activator NlpD